MPYTLPKMLSRQNASKLLEKVDNFLFDCDGVIWDFPHALRGSVECINKLKSLGKKCFFVTNNSTKTRQTLLETFEKVGINDVSENEIIGTSWVLARYLKSIDFKDKVYVIGSPAMGKELDEQGIKHTGIGPNSDEFPDPAKYNYRRDLKLDPEVKCVAVGFDHYFNFPKIVIGTSYVEKVPGCLFICTNDDAMLPTGPDCQAVIPGTGTMVNALRTSIGCKEPLILGKPHKTMWEVLAKTHNLDPSRTCMVGDRLDTDIAFAAHNSLAFSLAVLSGVCDENQIKKYSEALDLENGKHEDGAHLCPDYYATNLGEFGEFMKPE